MFQEKIESVNIILTELVSVIFGLVYRIFSKKQNKKIISQSFIFKKVFKNKYIQKKLDEDMGDSVHDVSPERLCVVTGTTKCVRRYHDYTKVTHQGLSLYILCFTSLITKYL